MRKYDIWLADLDPSFGTEAGKTRPVVIVQTDMLNGHHPSTIVCPITSKPSPKAKILRIALNIGEGNLDKNSNILVDQIRTIDKQRLTIKYGEIVDTLKQEETIEALCFQIGIDTFPFR